MKTKFEIFLEYLDNNKEAMTRVTKGSDFEGSLQQALKKSGFNQVVLDTDVDLKDYVQKIKKKVHSKTESVLLKNTLADGNGQYIDFFVAEPYGSQNFPDFMVFTEKDIIMIESKFTKGKTRHPMWNSNLPKKNSYYVYGSAQLNTLVYFVGDSVLEFETRNKLIENELKIESFVAQLNKEFAEEFKDKNTHGFTIYPRLAFHNHGTTNLFDETLQEVLIKEAQAFQKENKL